MAIFDNHLEKLLEDSFSLKSLFLSFIKDLKSFLDEVGCSNIFGATELPNRNMR